MPRHSLNLDFSQRLVISSKQLAWVPAPPPRVWRKQFEREAPERGHATSLVRYQAGARFHTHSHPMGEEILVLEGVFSDEQGDYPAGTYLRNPPGYTHTPYSSTGCVLFVKLNQFQEGDTQRVVLRPDDIQWQGGEQELDVVELHSFGGERTVLMRWRAGVTLPAGERTGGEEVLIIEGGLRDEHGSYPRHTWIRSPHLSSHSFVAEEEGLALVKTGHLPQV